MANGLFEGIQKCYCGKNITQKHIFIAILCLIIALPIAIAQAKLGIEAKEDQIYSYIFQKMPVMFLTMLASTFILTLYQINFTHNALKFFFWRDTQEDQERINAIQIMPEINKQIFNYIWQYIGFIIVWVFNFILIMIICAVLLKLPFLGLLFSLAVFLIITFGSPYLFVGFAKSFRIKGNISPLLIIQYCKGTVLSTLWLYIKTIGLSILLYLGVLIFGVVIGFLGGDSELLANPIVLTIFLTIFTYASMILYFAFEYAAAYIYYDKIELYREI